MEIELGISLILRARPDKPDEKRYALQLRTHDLSGTDYGTIAVVSTSVAEALTRTRYVGPLYDDPVLSAQYKSLVRGSLRLRWERDHEDLDKSFVFEIVEDGNTIEVLRGSFDVADTIRSTHGVEWHENLEAWFDDFLRASKLKRAGELRREAETLEREASELEETTRLTPG